MHKVKSVRVTLRARGDLRRLGIPLKDAANMVQKSAITTHERGNRRYKNFILRVTDKALISVWALPTEKASSSTKNLGKKGCHICGGKGDFIVWEECVSCNGDGCSLCDNSGSILKRRRCQCVQKKGFLKKS